MSRRIVIHNHLPAADANEAVLRRRIYADDAYFSLTKQDPYQYKDVVAAARAKQPFNPPYPENTEFRKMWVAGYRSVLPG